MHMDKGGLETLNLDILAPDSPSECSAAMAVWMVCEVSIAHIVMIKGPGHISFKTQFEQIMKFPLFWEQVPTFPDQLLFWFHLLSIKDDFSTNCRCGRS